MMRFMGFTISYLALFSIFFALQAGFETGCVTGLWVLVTIFTVGFTMVFATNVTVIFEARVVACVVRGSPSEPSTLVQGRGYLKKGIQTLMAQGRSTKIILLIKWIRTSRLSMKKYQLWFRGEGGIPKHSLIC